MRTRVMTAYALCSVAERHIRDGKFENALDTIRVIRRLMTEASRLAIEPQTHTSFRETAELLPELESRVAKLESAIG